MLQETTDKRRVDAIDKEKQKDLRAYRAQLAREAKAQKELERKKKAYTWQCTKCNKGHTNYRCNVCEASSCQKCFTKDGKPCKCADEGWEVSVIALGPNPAPAIVETLPVSYGEFFAAAAQTGELDQAGDNGCGAMPVVLNINRKNLNLWGH